MFRNGFYVEKSEKMTLYFYRRAMELVWQDNVSNNKYLGCVYQRVVDLFYEGIGTAQDDAESFRYYQLAEECYIRRLLMATNTMLIRFRLSSKDRKS